jgi:hypothetical protein
MIVYPLSITWRHLEQETQKTSMNEVYFIGCLDQIKNNEFALLVIVSIWKLGHRNFHKGYHPIK